MPEQHDVEYALTDMCEKYCLNKTRYNLERGLMYQECLEECLDITEGLSELLKDIVSILEQHGKEIGRIEKDLSRVMHRWLRHAYLRRSG